MEKVYREERFRTPLADERSLGLWVDRIGFTQNDSTRADNFRILGQFAAIAVEKGAGTIETTAGGAPIPLQKGDAFVIFPSLTERYQPNPQSDTFWVVWNGPEADILHRIGYISEEHPTFRGGAAIVYRTWERLNPLMDRQDRSALLQRKTAILDMLRELDSFRNASIPSVNHEAISSAINELMRDSTGRKTVGNFAKQAHMSPAYFRRLFKTMTGTTPKTFQIAQRITRAKELLSAGKSIKETSDALGFSDIFHFMRVFKKLTHQTAGHYIGTHRG